MRVCASLATWLMLGTIACVEPPYFAGSEAVMAQLRQHESEYVAVAKRVAAKPDAFLFVMRGSNSFGWNNADIEQVAGGFKVATYTADVGTRVVHDLDSAARLVGATGDEIASWSEMAGRLHIYSVRHLGQRVEICLQGSDKREYGLQYALTRSAYEEMQQMAAPGHAKGPSEVTQLFGPWFYFERAS